MTLLNKQDTINFNTIEEQGWIEYYRTLWYDGGCDNDPIMEIDVGGLDVLTIEEIQRHESCCYACKTCWKVGKVPPKVARSMSYHYIKKEIDICENHRSTTLLDTAYKLYARIFNSRSNVMG